MRLFDLVRSEDETGVSGVGLVAQGVEFDDGTCALRWLTRTSSTAVYARRADVETIHGHGGKTKILWRDDANTFDRARHDFALDQVENVPFASVGGVDRRESMTAPEYITGEWARREYLRGYSHVAEIAYGPDWRTCSFIRSAAFEVGGKVR